MIEIPPEFEDVGPEITYIDEDHPDQTDETGGAREAPSPDPPSDA